MNWLFATMISLIPKKNNENIVSCLTLNDWIEFFIGDEDHPVALT